MTITLLGAARTVTGSKTLLEADKNSILIDCGIFQGYKELRLKNWEKPELDFSKLSFIILTHAHLDHCGYLPLAIKNGFMGKILCTELTKKLAQIILLDSAHIQEADAARANKYKYSKHKPALPLYTEKEVEKVFDYFKTLDYNEKFTFGDVTVEFFDNSHLPGAVSVNISKGGKTICFSGDLGRKHPLIQRKTVHPQMADVVICESTYGNRMHTNYDPVQVFERTILNVIDKNGIILIPSFAVERTQEVLYLLSKLYSRKNFPAIPVYVDSPMAMDVQQILVQYQNEFILSEKDFYFMDKNVKWIKSVDESKIISNEPTPKIVIAGSGMITGGRILHYLDKYIEKESTSIILVGYQSPGTRGHLLMTGGKKIKLFGNVKAVKASISTIDILSGHADKDEILDWLKKFGGIKTVILNHGEQNAMLSLKREILAMKLAANVLMPKEQSKIYV